MANVFTEREKSLFGAPDAVIKKDRSSGFFCFRATSMRTSSVGVAADAASAKSPHQAGQVKMVRYAVTL